MNNHTPPLQRAPMGRRTLLGLGTALSGAFLLAQPAEAAARYTSLLKTLPPSTRGAKRQAVPLSEQAQGSPTKAVPTKDGYAVRCPITPGTGQDVTDQMNKWLATLPNGFVADLAGGRYRCERPVILNQKKGTVLKNGTLYRTDRDGHGGLVYPQANPHIYLMQCVDCTVDSVRVEGTNNGWDKDPKVGEYIVKYEFEAGVRVEGGTGCAVVRFQANNVWGDGIHLHGTANVTVSGSTVGRNGRQGITVNAWNALVQDCRVDYARAAGLDIEPIPKQKVGNIVVKNCYLRARAIPVVCSGYGTVTNVVFDNNMTGGENVPIYHVRAVDGSRRSQFTIKNHRSEIRTKVTQHPALYFVNVDDITVENNAFNLSGKPSDIGLHMVRCGGDIKVLANQFSSTAAFVNDSPLNSAAVNVTGLMQR